MTLSTLFPPDPTLTVNNVNHIMEKVEPKMNMLVWNGALQNGMIQFVSGKKISFKEEECADIYVNCCHFTSWERLARSLYRHHQVAAVEEVRSYLPPRGQPHYGVLYINFFCIFNYTPVIHLYGAQILLCHIAIYNVRTHKPHYSVSVYYYNAHFATLHECTKGKVISLFVIKSC